MVVQFNARGVVKKYNFFHLMTVLTQGLVLLSLSTLFVHMLAATSSPRSAVYRPVMHGHFDYQFELGSFGSECPRP